MRTPKILLSLLLLGLVGSFAALPSSSRAQDDGLPFATYEDFQAALDAAVANGTLDAFWDTIVASGQMPLTFGDTAVFMYRGEAESIDWRGDFTAWDYDPMAEGERIADSDIWIMVHTFPTDARLDYKIVIDSTNWILDPLNPDQQVSGFGPNSELHMPDYVYSPYVTRRDDIEHGDLSDDITISSQNMGYTINYRVYLPVGYENLDDLPVIYTTDGHEYANDEMGSMVIVLDNLIADGLIRPVIAVFVDPRNPDDASENRRADELITNDNYSAFLADELVPTIDMVYDTDPSPDARVILGTSLGGLNAAFIGFTQSDVFHGVAIQSPAFGADMTILDEYQNSDLLPLNIFMSQGTVWDDIDATHQMRDLLESKGYPLLFIEVSEGHSWGNWRALIDDILIYFFGVE